MADDNPEKNENNKSHKKKEKAKPANVKIPPKKPQLSKKERRELQEKQRAAKAAALSGGGGGNKKSVSSKNNNKDNNFNTSEAKKDNEEKSGVGYNEVGNSIAGHGNDGDKALQMFAHLPQYRDRSIDSHLSGVVLHSTDKNLKVKLHPAVYELGVKYANGSIRGGNARCRAMMETFKTIIRDYVPPTTETRNAPSPEGNSSTVNQQRRNDLPSLLDQQVIKPSFQHWTTYCRAHSITMGNAVNFLKIAIANLSRDEPLESAQRTICEQIDAYIKERIDFADELITKHGLSKIVDNDVILVFGRSEVIQTLMLEAYPKKKFRVIVADSRPFLEGRQMLDAFVKHGIPCTYILLNALSYVMSREVTKVFLGVAALMSDGSVLSRVGTGTVALIAQSSNIPVLFCCETYKISNRVQLESFTGNELGNPHDIARIKHEEKNEWLDDWEQEKRLKLLNLIYDLTPSEFVSGIITELGILPPTSVAVLLREMNISNTV